MGDNIDELRTFALLALANAVTLTEDSKPNSEVGVFLSSEFDPVYNR